jgi:hypothetical protein
MKSIRSLFIRGLGAAATLAVVAFCSLNAQAEVVFGELGTAVVAPIDTPATDSGSQDSANVNWLAHGLDAGLPSHLALASATLGVIGTAPGTIPLTAAIFANPDGLPTPAIDASDVGSIHAVDGFMADAPALQRGEGYALAMNGSDWQAGVGLRLTPVDRSDFGSLSAKVAASAVQATIPQGPWSRSTGEESADGTTEEAAPKMEAVPEPSSAIVAGFGILGVAVMHRRRRRS